MSELYNHHPYLNRLLAAEVLRLLFDGQLEQQIDMLATRLIPKSSHSDCCCIYKDRAMVRYRIMALLGVDIAKEDDELKSLASYLKDVLEHDKPTLPILTSIETACVSCPPDRYVVNDSCKGCVARPCLANCPKDCIAFTGGTAHIDDSRCTRCGKCKEVCPFHAVTHLPVPCEAACPVKAVHKNESGSVEIDHGMCIGCGRCSVVCPFGAITERSSLIPLAKLLLENEPVVALIDPAIEGQLPGSLGQIQSALQKVGFQDVLEVAQANVEFCEQEVLQLARHKTMGEGYLITSSCHAFAALVDKHLPFLNQHRSSTPPPMARTAEVAKRRHPEAKIVFIGPCYAKKLEAAQLRSIDLVITFSELAALLVAKQIDVGMLQASEPGNAISIADGRRFALSGGVASCIVDRYAKHHEVQAVVVNGVDRKQVRAMKGWEKRPVDADLVEIACCEGGCINGCGVAVKPAVALKLRRG